MAEILVADDNETIRAGLEAVIRPMGHRVHLAASGREALALLRRREVDFVISDLKMEEMDGVTLLREVAELDPDCPVMIITAYGTVETAVEAMKLGAFDFIEKPFTPDVVRLKVERALALREERRARRRLEAENRVLREETEERFGELVGAAPVMQEVFRVIAKVAPTNTTVLLTGESGTGKELAARAIHQRSKRADGPFVKVNCAALADTLLESELFGHEKGAFTGAVRRHLGRFELASGGTLFLDEVGDVSPAMQVRLLRVLQERKLERVGGERTIPVDVRVVAATNRDLTAAVAEGRFREDLYYRLHVVPLRMPALRERRDDIPLLVRHFVARMAPRVNPAVRGITGDAVARLMAHDWPGNVRELENALEQALVFAEGELIDVASLPAHLRGEAATEGAGLSLPRESMSLPEILEDLERQLITRAFKEAGGVKAETARRLGVKPSALYYKLDKYGIR